MKHSSYNNLHTIAEADLLFTDRQATLSKLASLLNKHSSEGQNFGVCIVHRHCTLDEGEIMVAEGDVSQPKQISTVNGKVFPERWLATGEAYEFTLEQTTTPSAQLFEEFRNIVGDGSVLGLCYISSNSELHTKIALETTVGRSNIIEYVMPDPSRRSIPTTWKLQKRSNDSGLEEQSYVILQECSQCLGLASTHIANTDKMKGLYEIKDLGQYWELDKF